MLALLCITFTKIYVLRIIHERRCVFVPKSEVGETHEGKKKLRNKQTDLAQALEIMIKRFTERGKLKFTELG